MKALTSAAESEIDKCEDPLMDANTMDRRRFLKRSAGSTVVLGALTASAAAKEGTKMQAYICKTCGTQFAESAKPPESCPICTDERQYVGWNGQQWTTLAEMQGKHRNTVTELEPGVWAIHTEPQFGIGQQAHLIRTPGGNVLWDCVSFLDEATKKQVRDVGGIAAIAISHPPFTQRSSSGAGPSVMRPCTCTPRTKSG
jgi:hypothetical protein